MKTLLWILSVGSLVGSVATVALLASLLRNMPGGPFIGGAGVLLAFVLGAILVVLVATGLIASAALRRHGDPGLMRVHLWFAGILLTGAAAWGLSLVGRQAEMQRQAEAAWQRSKQDEKAMEAMLADPAQLAAHIAQYGVNAPIAGTWMSPLEAAAQYGHTALVVQMAGQGATVTENALALAASRADTAMLTAMLAHRGPDGANGKYALEAAYRQGRADMLRQMADAGLAMDLFVRDVIAQKQYLQFWAGDVDWQRASASWSRPDLPANFKEAVDKVAARDRATPGEFSEKQVLEVLNALAVLDPPDGASADPARLRWPPGHLIGNPAANWQSLRDLHPEGVIVPAYAGQGFRLLKSLTAGLPDKSGGGGLSIVTGAVAGGDVTLVEVLEAQGYSLKAVARQPALAASLLSPDHGSMRAYLKRRGIRLPDEADAAPPRQ